MKLGFCNCCGKKIGAKTVNGALRYNKNMRQISVVFKTVSNAQDTYIHLPVCVECCGTPNFESIKTLNHKDSTLKKYFSASPDVLGFDRFEVDPVVAGVQIENYEG